jgi:hypothetical protein
MAGRYGLQVTAVEVQSELHRAAEELTQRCHLEAAVSHVCADILGTGLSLEVPNCACYKGLACYDDNLLRCSSCPALLLGIFLFTRSCVLFVLRDGTRAPPSGQ